MVSPAGPFLSFGVAPAAAGFVSVSSLIHSFMSGSLKDSVRYQNQPTVHTETTPSQFQPPMPKPTQM